ncbi:MAG: HEAT repeat domain-containing protein [Polyangiaceae bacterium]
MRRRLVFSALSALLLATTNVLGATQATLTPSGGLGALAVRIEGKGKAVRAHACVATPCSPDGGTVIEAPEGFAPTAAEPVVETVTLGSGKSVVHVRIEGERDASAWELLIAPSTTGGPNVLFSGLTGYAHGEDGERTGDVVTFLGEGPEKTVVVGTLREDLRICGEDATVLEPRAIDPKTMQLRGASMQRLSKKERAEATKIVATARRAPADVPLAPLLIAAGASSAIGAPSAISDGDPATTWGEARPGAGSGELVVLRAPADVPITHLELTFAPPPAAGAKTTTSKTAAPKSLYLVTAEKIYSVLLPEDASLHPGESYEVAFTDPLRTPCLTVVLDETYSRDPHPDVAIAEITALSSFDTPGAKLEDIAKMLGGGGPRAEAAAALLKRAGDPGLAAVDHAWPGLDSAGKALAADVASSAGCAGSAPILIRALVDTDREVARKGEQSLDRCGRVALPALAKAVGEGDDRARAIERAAFMRAAHITDPKILPPILADDTRSPVARIDLLRAASARLPEIPRDAEAAIDATLKADASVRSRYLLLAPLASLARAGSSHASSIFVELLAHDPSPMVRMHAAELSAHIAAAQGALLGALGDAEPRVREAALRTVADEHLSPATVAVERLLERDPFSFVRASAATALGAFPAAVDLDRALAASLKDGSVRVRVAVVEALGTHRARTLAKEIGERADDENESLDVRVAAVRALGASCDAGSLGRLSDFAAKVSSQMASDVEVALGLAAVEALGALHPADIARRLAPLTSAQTKPAIRKMALDAIAQPGSCR